MYKPDWGSPFRDQNSEEYEAKPEFVPRLFTFDWIIHLKNMLFGYTINATLKTILYKRRQMSKEDELREKERLLAAALSTQSGIKKIGDVIHKHMVGDWKKLESPIPCPDCKSLNTEHRLGLMQHWSGAAHRCLDCGHFHVGLQPINRGFLIVEKLEDQNVKVDYEYP